MQGFLKRPSNKPHLIQKIQERILNKSKQYALNNHKTSRQFTQVIFEDNKLFHEIKIYGMQFPQQKTFQKYSQSQQIRSKSSNTERKPRNVNKAIVFQSSNQSISKWANKTATVLKKKQSVDKHHKLERYLTLQSPQKEQQSLLTNKSEVKIIKNNQKQEIQKNLNQKSNCKQQNLNNQVYFSFKQILDQFNKVKQIIKEKSEQGNKPPKAAERHFRHASYKKPQIYQFQQFYKQNLHKKQLKKPIFQLACTTNNYKKAERKAKVDNLPLKQFKIYQSQQNNSVQEKQRNNKKAVAQNNYLQIKSHGYSIFQKVIPSPKKRKISLLNKSQMIYPLVKMEREQQKIQPWSLQDNNQLQF